MKAIAVIGSAVLMGSAAAPARAEPCPDVMLVQDRSGSMVAFSIGGKTKWQINMQALKDVLPTFNLRIPMGLAVFPDESATGFALFAPPNIKQACVPGGVLMDPAPGNVPKILDRLAKMKQPDGATPTWETLARLQDYAPFKDGSRPHYVVLITDGQPNCTERECCPDLGMCDVCKLWKCTGAASTIEQIEMLAKKGIKTFVVGFAGVGEGGACMVTQPFDPDSLDRMAEAGGMPRGSPAPRKYYDVSDHASFRAALEDIAGKIAGATAGGCVASGGGMDGGGGAGGGGQDASGGGQDGAGTGGGPGAGRQPRGGCTCRAGDAPRPPALPNWPAGLLVSLALRPRPAAGHRKSTSLAARGNGLQNDRR